jgi:feruloyl-CoA synthase
LGANTKNTEFLDKGLAPRAVNVEHQGETLILTSPTPPTVTLPRLSDHLRKWAATRPNQTFMAERAQNGDWLETNYKTARQRVDEYASGLLSVQSDTKRPLAVLSANSVDNGLLQLAAMQIGKPVLTVSTAYALLSDDFERLKTILTQLQPDCIYVGGYEGFERAIDAAAPSGSIILTDQPVVTGGTSANLNDWRGRPIDIEVERAFAATGPDTVARLLMTSGSTGAPKAVMITQGTIASNGAGVDALWPFLAKQPPVMVDWLPWSHTFAANFNLSQILRHGGSLYLDNGKPAPGLIDTTLKNLSEIQPTLLYNVPRGFDLLVDEFERDSLLRDRVFANLDVIFYAGSALAQSTWDRLEALAISARGARLPILSSLGSTECGPVAVISHWGSDETGSVGLPVPGTEIKLVPDGGKLEVRVKGPSVTPGYYQNEAATAKAFDEEGFFKLGDAVRFVDPDIPEAGLLFDGRLSENFKLATGTWVHVGTLRLDLITACAPLIQDAVIVGHDSEAVRTILIPNVEACRGFLAASTDASITDILSDEKLISEITNRLAVHNREHPGTSSRIKAFVLDAEPLSVDLGEITDKGYINQRAVIENRASRVEALIGGEIGRTVEKPKAQEPAPVVEARGNSWLSRLIGR